ncbi:5-formyltetrahydrofolate cyclo-ligase [Bdellovibrio bacteriovorus]|uniref:5-formyltetrahydrofolate cyclo-ligase n=2 Tax=Bdellovibrio bacteriovorus TaxID=959 RepID=A0A162FY85_BDEBC|nr:5-formyltetrahydrofolate cyclo-ligase [Bdellovibrio bacteriovorus]
MSMSFPWSSKKECRSFFKSLCAREFAQGLVQNQQQLNSVLQDFLKSQSGVWGAYRALPEEAQVEEVFRISHLKWAFPRMREGHLEFFDAHKFVLGPYGVLEPAPDSPAQDLKDIQGLLIPGLVFNKNGNRLGKGKGFYDKTLSAYQGIKVGVCFNFQVTVDPIPTEAHDVIMDYLITETGVVDCRKYQE